MIRIFCLLCIALALVGCAPSVPVKRYPLQGDVVSVDATAKTANIAAGKIEGWMDAMTMEYSVKPEAELVKLHAGDHIEATLVVQGDKYYVTDVKVLPKQ